MLSAEEIEAQYHQRVADQARALAAKRFANPDRDYTLEDVWVVYVWEPTDPKNPAVGQWLLAGFRRKRNLRKPQTMGRFFSKIRRRLVIEKKQPVMLLDLADANRRIHAPDQSWRTRPPQFQSRKAKVKITKPALLTQRGPKVRAKMKAKVFSKSTKFVVLGRHGIWNRRKPGYVYLGPLVSTQKRLAEFEAKRLFPIYTERLVIPVNELSPPTRHAMLRNRKVKAGVTRIQWPEVPPTFESMYGKFLEKTVDNDAWRAAHIREYYAMLRQRWMDDGSPWLTVGWFRKTMKRATTPTKTVWTRWQTFKCTRCGSEADTPSSINHGTVQCVPTPVEDDSWARDAKAHARKIADRKRKRKARRDARVRAKEKAQARKRAAKKAARTRAKKSAIRGKDSARSSRTRMIVRKAIALPIEPKLNTLRIVAVLRPR